MLLGPGACFGFFAVATQAGECGMGDRYVDRGPREAVGSDCPGVSRNLTTALTWSATPCL